MNHSSRQVIIMRPRAQAQALAETVRSKHAIPIVLPMIDIQPVSVDNSQIAALYSADYLVISSQNSVWHASAELIQALQSTRAKVVTIGPSTAEALIEKAIPVFFTAPKGSQSETLLTLEPFQADRVKNKEIVLLVGKGGRDLIAKTLIGREARVVQLEVYQQVPVHTDLASMIPAWQQQGTAHCFVVTSLNILTQFISQIPEQYLEWCHSQTLIVVSDRIQFVAKQCGFQHIVNAHAADNVSLTAALDRFLKLCNTGPGT
jgi:uroporphyrinogen-III synthase